MKEKLKIAGRAFLAAVTSPEAVKLEKGLAVLVVTRVAIALGAGVGFVQIVESVINAF